MLAGKSTDAVIGFGEIKLVDQNSLNILVSEAVKTYLLEYLQEITALKAELLEKNRAKSLSAPNTMISKPNMTIYKK